MSILKIKDSQDNWVGVQSIQGEKGDPFTYADFTPEQLESLKGKDGISPTVSVVSDTSDDYRLSFTDETHTVTTPNLIPEAEKILSVYPHDTASGSIASFADGADDIPLKSCIVRVDPVQAGSGDPSPENERPITGWTWCEVQRTGKNLIPADIEYVGNYSHTNYIIRNGIYRTFYFPVPKGMILYHTDITKAAVQCGLIDEPLAVGVQIYGGLQNLTNYNNRLIDNTEGHKYLFVMTGNSDDGLTAMERIKEFGISFLHQNYAPGVYTEPKPSATYPITFPTEAGIVYGGYVDATGGELVVDRAQIASYNGEALPSTWISDRDVYASGTTPTIGAQVVYKLAEPIRYPLTPTEIKTLLGTNNIWADTGDTEVEYRASTKMYIDRKIAEAVAAALNS